MKQVKPVWGCRRLKKKKEWITPDTWQAIEERRQLKKKISDSRSARLRVRYRAAYAETNRCVKRKIRTDKKAHERADKRAEEASQKREQRIELIKTAFKTQVLSGQKEPKLTQTLLTSAFVEDKCTAIQYKFIQLRKLG